MQKGTIWRKSRWKLADEPVKSSGFREQSEAEEKQMADWWSLAGLGFEFIAALLVPGAIGFWLDKRFNSAPWVMLVGGLVGFAIGLRQLIRAANRTFKN